MKITPFQRGLVEKLRSGEKNAYEEAAIYTVLLDMVEGCSLDEVATTLHNLATGIGQRKELEMKMNQLKEVRWDQNPKP